METLFIQRNKFGHNHKVTLVAKFRQTISMENKNRNIENPLLLQSTVIVFCHLISLTGLPPTTTSTTTTTPCFSFDQPDK